MMDNDSGWIDNSDGDHQQYDFWRPGAWTGERAAREQAAIIALIEGVDAAAAPDADADPDAAAASRSDAASSAPGWLGLVKRLPAALRTALLIELRAGNRLAGIGSSGWPNDGSIVVNLRERFSAARQALPGDVAWRALDDPHYAREELSQKAGGVEFLVIT